MKQKKTSRLLASVLAIAMGATMTSGLFTAQAQEEIGENTIIHAFKKY